MPGPGSDHFSRVSAETTALSTVMGLKLYKADVLIIVKYTICKMCKQIFKHKRAHVKLLIKIFETVFYVDVRFLTIIEHPFLYHNSSVKGEQWDFP